MDSRLKGGNDGGGVRYVGNLYTPLKTTERLNQQFDPVSYGYAGIHPKLELTTDIRGTHHIGPGGGEGGLLVAA